MGSSILSWRRQWHPTPVLLPGKSHGWRSLVGCSPWGREELDMTERLHFHFSLSLEKEIATHSSVLAWRIPGTGSHRVRHEWSDLAAVAACSTRRKPQRACGTLKFTTSLMKALTVGAASWSWLHLYGRERRRPEGSRSLLEIAELSDDKAKAGGSQG